MTNQQKMDAAIKRWKAQHAAMTDMVEAQAFAKKCADDFGNAARCIEADEPVPERYDGIDYPSIRMAEDKFRDLAMPANSATMASVSAMLGLPLVLAAQVKS